MATIIRVSIPLKVDPFDYSIPESLEGKVDIGTLVIVPLRNQKFLGIVTEFIESSPHKLKYIYEIFEDISLGEKYVKYLKWVSEYYHLSLGKVLEFALPIKQQKHDKINHPPKKEIYIELTSTFNSTLAMNSFSRFSQKELIQYLDSEKKVSLKELKEVFKTRVKTVLPKLEELGFIETKEVSLFVTPQTSLLPSRPNNIHLTKEQSDIISHISTYIEQSKSYPYLLRGVTGSGKTEVYYQLIKKAVELGKNALILLPEIALTDQTVAYFLDLIDFSKIAIIHSNLTPSQKSNYWYQIAQKQIRVVIGARSAVFAPVHNLGLIIIDEEQDHSYKQSETAFRYHARDLAVLLGSIHSIPVLLGTATPSLETLYNVSQKRYSSGNLPQRINQMPLPEINVVDLKEKDIFIENTSITKPLYWALKEVVQKKEQAIIYLNKRGYHGNLICSDCGYVLKCSSCDVAYTYYKNDNKLKCHYCLAEMTKPNFCPQCQSKKIKHLSIGTEKVMEELQTLFPKANIDRLDRDVITSYSKMAEVIRKVKHNETTILIGTQMVVKGHHFPNVTLVAVLLADQALHMPDIRASEHAFQDFVQVSGRAGRSEKKGQVILQTYSKTHYAIQYFIQQNFDKFWEHELEWRKALSYPPFFKMATVWITSQNEILLRQSVEKIKQYKPSKAIYSQPSEAPIYKIKNTFRFLIQIKSEQPKIIDYELTKLLHFIILLKLSTNIDILVDRDPLSL